MCTVLLSSCSLGGRLVLHNSSPHKIVLSVAYDPSWTKNHVIQPGDAATLEIDFRFSIEISAAVGDEHWCYKTKELSSSAWVKPGIFRGKVFALLTSDRLIYIYSKESKEDSFYTKSPPVQPDGYPLTPSVCTQ